MTILLAFFLMEIVAMILIISFGTAKIQGKPNRNRITNLYSLYIAA